MYIPHINLTTDKTEIIAFMKQYSFATLISAKDNYPTATHLPFIISEKEGKIVLRSHFARANKHWKELEKQQWDELHKDYKLKMLKGIVAFEVEVTDIQGKKKLSQNKSKQEQERIIDTLANSQYDSEVQIANFMRENLNKIP